MVTRQITILALIGLSLTLVAGTRFVTVDDTQPMPWTTIANDTNMLAKTATNALAVTALQITGGTPVNKALLEATNTVGQGTWRTRINVRANNKPGQKFTNTLATVTNWTEITDSTGSFNPTNGTFLAPYDADLRIVWSAYFSPGWGDEFTTLYSGETSGESQYGSWSIGGGEYVKLVVYHCSVTNGESITIRLRSNQGATTYGDAANGYLNILGF